MEYSKRSGNYPEVHPYIERMEENLNIWDFKLSNDDMSAISMLDLGHSEIIDHSTAETVKYLNGWKIHD